MLSYTDSASAREVKGSVARRGLCGDVFLVSTPLGSRIRDVRVDTSVQRKEITFNAALDGLSANGRFSLRARVSKDGRTIKDFKSQEFSENDFKQGRFAFTARITPSVTS